MTVLSKRSIGAITATLLTSVAMLTPQIGTVGQAAPVLKKFTFGVTSGLYHGVHPSGLDGDETFSKNVHLSEYEQRVGSHAAWVYFSQEWSQVRSFPTSKANQIRLHGSLPIVRLMLRSQSALDGKEGADPDWGLNQILAGKFDADLHRWASGARSFTSPVLLEVGTEVNGDWFGWNGRWNGAGTKTAYGNPIMYDGAEKFRDTYRKIVNIVRGEGANNVGFVFHIDGEDSPAVPWNTMELYYPGDAYVDLIGVSAYGSQTPMEKYAPTPMRTQIDAAYRRMGKVAPNKPWALIEFGTAKGGKVEPVTYTRATLGDLVARRWPKMIGFCWWNEGWPNDNKVAHNTTMRVQEQSGVAAVFTTVLQNSSIKKSWP